MIVVVNGNMIGVYPRDLFVREFPDVSVSRIAEED